MTNPTTPDHPLPGIANRLVPQTLTFVKLFTPRQGQTLEQQIDEWVESTGNLIVVPGPITDQGVAVTYVKASRHHNDPGQAKKTTATSQEDRLREAARPPSPSSIPTESAAAISDGRSSLAVPHID